MSDVHHDEQALEINDDTCAISTVLTHRATNHG